MAISRRELGVLGLGLVSAVILATLPLFTEGFWLSLGVNIMLYAAMCTAWTLFSGPTHLVSLGSAALFGVGTYSVAVFIDILPFPALILIAMAAGALLAMLVGLATLRLSGVYFVIFTLGLAELIGQVVTWVQTKFGRAIGLYVFTDFTESHLYWMLLVLTVVVFIAGWLIDRSRLGFAMRIIGNDETVARHVGVDTARSRIVLFAVSGAFIAIAGAIMAPRYSYITPQAAFNPMTSFLVVIMALLGGTRRLWGPLVGVIPFTLLMDFISGRFPNHTPIIVGVAFLAIVFLLPDGVTGRLEQLFRLYRSGAGEPGYNTGVLGRVMARATQLSSLDLRGLLLQKADFLFKQGSHRLGLSRQRLGQAMEVLGAGIARGWSGLVRGGSATTSYQLPAFNPFGSETGMTPFRMRLMTSRSTREDAPSADRGRAAHGHSRGGEQVSAPLLIVDRARKTFGGLVAVNDVSFKVEKGELLGLIGPNGSGKTTVLNLISGALSPTSGEIRLAGQSIGGLPAHKIARIGVARTFQLVRILPSMDALENVVAGAVFGHRRLWGDGACGVARDLLASVGLKGREEMPVLEMTYIDQKRVELARALASDPHLLLLDEWLAGLNPTELRIGIDVIRKISEQGRTIIMVEHVMDAIRSLCNRSVVMSSGVKIADGKSAEVLADPEVIRAYLGDEDA